MASIVDYSEVLQRLIGEGMRSLYHNSGAFGFRDAGAVVHRGWIGPDDPTLRPEALGMAQRVAAPFAANLAQLAAQVWRELLPGSVWVMPRSHWAYELEFGSGRWMPGLLEEMGLGTQTLLSRSTADAIAFEVGEDPLFEQMLQRLLENLAGSDFSLAFPGRAVVCTVHHHQQLWWSTTNPQLHEGLGAVAEQSGLMAPVRAGEGR